jgi:hypothetical protein
MIKWLVGIGSILLIVVGLAGCALQSAPVPPAPSPSPSPSSTSYLTELATLSAQVANLSNKVAAIPTPTPFDPTKIEEEIAALQAQPTQTPVDLSNINEEIGQLQAQVKQLQSPQTVVLGTSPVSIGGLGVSFIVPSQLVSVPQGATSPSYAQLSVKISNSNSYSLVNVDIVGSITFSTGLYGLAPNYPTLSDSVAGGVNYLASFNGANVINFEVYNFGPNGAALSIPANASVTLRPRVGLLASTGAFFNSVNAVIAITGITYDKGS